MIYNVLSFCIIGILTVILAVTLAKIFTKKRADRLAFIRGFKKGRCAIIYLVAIPLYWMGAVFAGGTVLNSFFSAIKHSISLVVLSYEMSPLTALIADSIPFAIAVYYTFVLVACNALLFSLSVLHQHLWQASVKAKWRRAKGEKLLILGYSEQSLWLYGSEQTRAKIIAGDVSKEQATSLFFKNIHFLPTHKYLNEILALIADATQVHKCVGTVVVNLNDDERALKLCDALCEKLAALVDSVDENDRVDFVNGLFSRINVYVFGSPAYESLYCKHENLSYGCIHYVNKYKQIALSTANEHPLSAFLPTDCIAPDTTLAPDTALDVSLVGFGKTNREIFLTSVANNVFLTKNKSGKVSALPVRYHVFDKNSVVGTSLQCAHLNHTYLRYQSEVLGQGHDSDYLPLPPLPATIDAKQCDVNDPAFYEAFRKNCAASKGAHLAIVAYGSDLENVELAEKLLEKAQEWGASNFHVFVKVRSGNTAYPIFDCKNCYILAPERTEVYDVSNLTANKLTQMAKERNRIYVRSAPKNAGKSAKELNMLADYKWHVTMSQMERESNVYALLGLRTKLHLLGLDYAEKESACTKVEDAEYFARYAEGKSFAGGKLTNLTEQDMISLDGSARAMLATQEHYRWNAFMICRGTIPATRNEILTDKKADGSFSNGKSYALRRHGNLTTMEGLIAFRKLVAERDGCTEADADVIRYDYQAMDEAPWMLCSQEYSIVKKD